jgi:hypothetical protein
VASSCKHGNEPSGFIQFLEVLEYLHNWRPLEKVSGTFSYLATTALSDGSIRASCFLSSNAYDTSTCIVHQNHILSA